MSRRPPPPKSRAGAKPVGMHPLLKSIGLQANPQAQAGALCDKAVESATQLFQQEKYPEAEQILRDAKVHQHQHKMGMHVLAVICAQTYRYAEAETLWKEILARYNDKALVYPNLGRSYQIQNRMDEAIDMLEQATVLMPNDYTARLNAGVAYQRVKDFKNAARHGLKAIEIRPQDAQAHFNVGKVFQDQYQFLKAFEYYQKTLALDANNQGAMSNYIFVHHYLERMDLESLQKLAYQLGDQLSAQNAKMKLHVDWAHKKAGEKIRIGLLSADLRKHPVGLFLVNLLAHIETAQFEFVAFSNAPQVDSLTERIQSYCAAWHQIDLLSDEDAAQLIAQNQIEILLDLSGLTAGNRLGVLAKKPAPKIVNWLGYFGTTGLPEVDYILADPYCIPENERHLYREKVIYLPHSRFCMIPPENMSPPENAPAPNGLPALHADNTHKTITLGCFQELAKINPRVLRAWAQVLEKVPNARLRFQAAKLKDTIERDTLTQKITAAGIALNRVELHSAVPRDAYFAAYHHIDFILDTFPYPGGTTTTEALWMGVPTLTLAEAGMLSRQGESLLKNVGLDDWVTYSEAEWIEKAQYWCSAQGLTALAQVRQNLRARCQASRLFNGALFAQDFGQAMLKMCFGSLLS